MIAVAKCQEFAEVKCNVTSFHFLIPTFLWLEWPLATEGGWGWGGGRGDGEEGVDSLA